jgi:hypothetical protein
LDPGVSWPDDGLMIVAVDGPSAAATWCRRQPWPVVVEYAASGAEPDGSDEERRAAYWVAVNSGVVLCDSDPLKLHYSWCLARIGAAPWSRFEHEPRETREAIAAGRLGFADVALVSIPSVAVLRTRKAADPTRQRRAFDLHARLREPLREWYTAVERAEPGRVDGPGPLPASRSPSQSEPIAAIQPYSTASSAVCPR